MDPEQIKLHTFFIAFLEHFYVLTTDLSILHAYLILLLTHLMNQETKAQKAKEIFLGF